jgi:GNAT superfamily N-acetyltransferase
MIYRNGWRPAFAEWRPYTDPKTGRVGRISAGGLVRYDQPPPAPPRPGVAPADAYHYSPPAPSGGGGHTIRVTDPATGQEIGHVEYHVDGDRLTVADVKVYSPYRRQGVATRLYERMLAANPGKRLATALQTDDGRAFRRAFDRRPGASPPIPPRSAEALDVARENAGGDAGRLPRELASVWAGLHNVGATPEEVAPIEAELAKHGVALVGHSGATVPFDGRLHRLPKNVPSRGGYSPVNQGEPVVVDRPGLLQTHEDGRQTGLVQARVRPASFAREAAVFSESPKLAPAGPDGARAAELLKDVQQAGSDTLSSLAERAIRRLLMLPNPQAAATLFDDAELEQLRDSLVGTIAVGDLLGRARVRGHAAISQMRQAFAEWVGPFTGKRGGTYWLPEGAQDTEENRQYGQEKPGGDAKPATENATATEKPELAAPSHEIEFDGDEDALRDLWNKLLPPPAPGFADHSPEHAGVMVGAPAGAKVKLESLKDEIRITVEDERISRCVRRFARQGDYLVCHNDVFEVRQDYQNQGIGADVFTRQAEALSAVGFDYIQCYAARGKEYNGYYTWPRFGYDQTLASLARDNPRIVEEVKNEFPDANSILDVMSTAEGREWWRENGTDLPRAKFDLDPADRSMRVLTAYAAARRSASPQSKRHPSTEPGNNSTASVAFGEPRVARFDDAPLPTDPFHPFPEPIPATPPAEAVAYFQKLVPTLGSDPFRYGPLLERHAFTLAVATEQTLLDKVKKAIGERLSGAAPLGSATADVQDILDAAGVSPANPQYADMVVRTNLCEAYNAGATAEMQSPEMQEFFPWWRYDGILDSRTGDDHRPKIGKYYPASAVFADVRGPRVWNCRCCPTPVFRSEVAELQARGVRPESEW